MSFEIEVDEFMGQINFDQFHINHIADLEHSAGALAGGAGLRAVNVVAVIGDGGERNQSTLNSVGEFNNEPLIENPDNSS